MTAMAVWRKRFGTLLAGALVAFTPAACGNLTSGGVGDVEVFAVADDPPLEGSAPVASSDFRTRAERRIPASATSAGLSLMGGSMGDLIEGSITFRVRIEVLSDDGDWTELTEGAREGTLRLEGTDEVRLAARGLATGRYRRVRMMFGRIEAMVVRGLNVDGEPIIGSVPVDIAPGGMLMVEEAIDLVVREGETAALLLDLNVQLWLRRVDRMRHRVDMRDFSDAVRMRSR